MTWPEVGVSKPASSPSKVDLPEPEVPVMAKSWARIIEKLISFNIVSKFSGLSTCLVRCSARMMTLCSIFRLSLLVGLLLQSIPIGATAQPVILGLGDSLSASYGIHLDQGWVAQLRNRLIHKDYAYQVVNASISGETTRGALARLDSLLEAHKPKIVIVELGGNDGLRGLSLAEMQRNFSRIIEKSQQSGARVLLVRMRLPPNYGPAYTERFQKLFIELE